MRLMLVGALIVSFITCGAQAPISIIPLPVNLQKATGYFSLDSQTAIQIASVDRISLETIHFFAASIQKITGKQLPINKKSKKQIRFTIEKTEGIGNEGYLLSVTPDHILVKANTSAGWFYAIQSILQTMSSIRTNHLAQIPCMEIIDYPRFPWRGLMLDVSRHFFSPELVKEFIDLLAAYKMNVFHWHLVDGAGWRIEIKKYPRLTQLAAWRVNEGKPWNWGEIQFNSDPEKANYGGYYTQMQIKDIVSYAQTRHITIVPEIEMPGHSEIAMAAYPELSCNPKDHFGKPGNFFAKDVASNYCAGNDSAFIFLQNVLTEVMGLFPSTYIHVGGDEVDKSDWRKCPKCQARIKTEGLKNENELQSYFIRRIEKFLVSKKRKLIGWDEILEGGLAPEATVMSWRGETGGIAAAKMNHDVIMTPESPCYFDHYQGDPLTEPPAIGGFNTLQKVYNYEPVPAVLSNEEGKHVLGSQANLWTEYIPSYEQAEYMVLPRLPALAEVLWTPKTQRNWKSFTSRLQPHLFAFEQKGMHYSKGNFKVDIKPETKDGKLFVSLETENPDATIFYTTDGGTPTTGSERYTAPISINSSLTLKTVMALDNVVVSTRYAERMFSMNMATGRNVTYNTPYSRYYPASGPNALTDGIRGTSDIGSNWHGFNGRDMTATVDLENAVLASSIGLGCLQNWARWIFFPHSVMFEISEDGTSFKVAGSRLNSISMADRNVQTKEFAVSFPQQKVKAIRITAKNPGPCPAGHPGADQPSWIFADEIILK